MATVPCDKNEFMFSSLREHMLTNENIVKWTSGIKPIGRNVPIKTTVTPKLPPSDIFISYMKDKLFWCFFVINEGLGAFERIKDKSFSHECDFKYNSIAILRNKVSGIKTHKLKLIDIEGELVGTKPISLMTVCALAMAYNKSILYKKDRIYYDFPFGEKYYLIEATETNTRLHLGDVADVINKTKATCFLINPSKKIKSISSYTLKDLQDIALKLEVPTIDDNTKSYKKSELYSLIVTKIEKLT